MSHIYGSFASSSMGSSKVLGIAHFIYFIRKNRICERIPVARMVVIMAMKALWLDDPLDAVAVHYGGGRL